MRSCMHAVVVGLGVVLMSVPTPSQADVPGCTNRTVLMDGINYLRHDGQDTFRAWIDYHDDVCAWFNPRLLPEARVIRLVRDGLTIYGYIVVPVGDTTYYVYRPTFVPWGEPC